MKKALKEHADEKERLRRRHRFELRRVHGLSGRLLTSDEYHRGKLYEHVGVHAQRCWHCRRSMCCMLSQIIQWTLSITLVSPPGLKRRSTSSVSGQGSSLCVPMQTVAPGLALSSV